MAGGASRAVPPAVLHRAGRAIDFGRQNRPNLAPQNDALDWKFDPPGPQNAVKKRPQIPGPKWARIFGFHLEIY